MKASLFTDDMIIYLSDPKNSARELLQQIKNFSQVTERKINSKNEYPSYIQTTNGLRISRAENTLYHSHNNIKYLGITLTKQVKDLDGNNVKCLMKEIEEDTRRWKNLP